MLLFPWVVFVFLWVGEASPDVAPTRATGEELAPVVSSFSLCSSERQAREVWQDIADDLQDVRQWNGDVAHSITSGWWDLAGDIVRQSHAKSVDLSPAVRAHVLLVKKRADELIRMLDKKHNQILKVSPAFQWAQSPEAVFLLVKFAFRWSSPGALAVEKENVTVTDNNLFFSGLGTNSHAGKLYELNLDLFDKVIPEATEWSFGSVGKLSVTLKKVVAGSWERLTLSNEKIPNGHIWWEMRESLEREQTERKAKEKKAADAAASEGAKSKDENTSETKVLSMDTDAKEEKEMKSDKEMKTDKESGEGIAGKVSKWTDWLSGRGQNRTEPTAEL